MNVADSGRYVDIAMQAVLHSFGYALDYLRELLVDAAPGDMVARPQGIPNHPAWTVGHLTHSCGLLGGVVGVPGWLPAEFATRFGTGSVPVADLAAYEAKDEALARLADAQARLAAAVARLDDAALDRPFPDDAYRPVFPTVRHALTQVMVGHASFHVGQVSVWRRAMGYPRLTRGFE